MTPFQIAVAVPRDSADDSRIAARIRSRAKWERRRRHLRRQRALAHSVRRLVHWMLPRRGITFAATAKPLESRP